MTEDEKTIKAWAYDKLMYALYNAAHSSTWKEVSFNDYDIGYFIRAIEPSRWEAILEKVNMEKERKRRRKNNEVYKRNT